ncbi:nuclear transport factor 2 family protein [Rhizobium sp. RCAM05350]|nr:nuclear transport factor 2 family protein [Rhizobium sp. RCAM05350]
MTSEALWKQYAAIWSMEGEERKTELAACLAGDATYCDPNGLIHGPGELSTYMGHFQQSAPGGQFQIQSVLHHHGRSLADWALQGPDGSILQAGTSFATLTDDGRLHHISGFFYPAKQDGHA